VNSILEDYENGDTVEDIALLYNISVKQVIQIIKDYGDYRG